MIARALDGAEVRTASLLLAVICFLYVRVAIAAPPMTLTCPDAGGAQTFLLDMDNAKVISATGRWRDSGRTELLFKDVPIRTTETNLAWQWVQEGNIRTYVLDRNTLELQIIDRTKPGWVEKLPSGQLLREYTFQLRCNLSRRQL